MTIWEHCSQVQEYKAALISRRIAAEQSVAGIADTQGWQFETC